MADLSGVDVSNVPAEMGVSPLPEGQYMATVTASEWKDAKSGAGQYLELIFAVANGQYQGRKIYTRLNLRNSNATAVEISKKEFRCILEAIGMNGMPQDSQQIHNIPMLIDVVLEPYKAQDGSEKMSNRIVGYHNRATASTTHAEPAKENAPWGAR